MLRVSRIKLAARSTRNTLKRTYATRPPVPPFTEETALKKVKAAEALWNTKDAEKVALAYTDDCVWRNRDLFFSGHDAIKRFLNEKWAKEKDYKLEKNLFTFDDDKIAVQFEYEYHNGFGQWYRAYGLEHWTFNADGLMKQRTSSINDVPINEQDRKFK